MLADAAGVWHTRDDEATEDFRELPLPPRVRDAVIVRVQRLDPAARRVLDPAALTAEPFVAALLAQACGLSEVDALIALEAAHQARLLAGRGAGWGCVHDLVPQSLAAAMDEQRRRSVHRRLALGPAAANAAPALVARHFEAGGEPARAAPYRLAAGDAAERLHALPEAVVQWRAALAALAEGPALAFESACRLRLVRTLRYLGDLAGSAAEVAALVALAPRLDPAPPRRGARHRGGPARRRCAGRQRSRRPLDGIVLIEERAGRPARALELLAEATTQSERIGDDFGVARGRYRRGTLLFHAGELAAFVFRAARVSALQALGEPAGAEEEARRAAELLQAPAHLQIEAALLLPLAPLARAAPQQLDTLAQALAAPAAAAGEPGLEWLRRLAAARC